MRDPAVLDCYYVGGAGPTEVAISDDAFSPHPSY